MKLLGPSRRRGFGAYLGIYTFEWSEIDKCVLLVSGEGMFSIMVEWMEYMDSLLVFVISIDFQSCTFGARNSCIMYFVLYNVDLIRYSSQPSRSISRVSAICYISFHP